MYRRRDAPWIWAGLGLPSVGVVLLPVGIVAFLSVQAWPALSQVAPGAWFAADGWHPTTGAFLVLPMVVASLAVTALAIVLAVPLALSLALVARYYAPPRLGGVLRRWVELLAGVPSVVFGLWGLLVVVPFLARWAASGSTLLAGGIILALMVLPTIAAATDTALADVPKRSVFAGLALGLSRGQCIRAVALPIAAHGIWTGVLLGIGRALGETMAVLMVTGNVVQYPDGLLSSVRTLTANIALEMPYAMQTHRAALFVTGLLLLLVTTFLVALAHRDRPRVSVSGNG